MENETTLHVLMIDDDKGLCSLIMDYLAPYDIRVSCATDGKSGVEMALQKNHDAVLLDMMLPGIDGLAILRRLRAEKPSLPVVIISSQTDVSDRIIGLEMGADDYVPKTLAPRELLARLRAVLRRSRARQGEADPEILSRHGILLDTLRMEASLDGAPLHLGTIEFKLLSILMSQPGRIFSREQLMDAIAGREYDGLDRTIDMHISALRRKLGDSPRNPSHVRTIRGSGYMFIK